MRQQGDRVTGQRGNRTLLFAVLAVAIVARIAASVPDLYHHPDEVWQYLEPAYWLVEGRMVRAWEYRAGIRSWLIPLFLTPPIWLGKLIDPDGPLYIALGRGLMAALSLPAVASAVVLGLRTSRLHALAMGLFAALWFDFVYFAPRSLSESIGLALIVPAACLAALDPRAPQRRLALIGLLLGLAVAARYQLVPLAGVIAIGTARLRPRDWGWLFAGGAAALVLSALADASMGQMPFRWLVRNFAINLLHDKASAFGVSPWYGYGTLLIERWGWGTVLIAPLALIGARRYPVMAIGFLALVVLHSFIPHKEYRFIVPGVALVILLAAHGLATVAGWAVRDRRGKAAMVVVVGLAACTVSLLQPLSWRGGRGFIEAARLAGGPGSCGLAIVGTPHPLLVAHYFLDRDQPVYAFIGRPGLDEARRTPSAYNRIYATRGAAAALPPGYRRIACPVGFKKRSDGLCVYARPGTCSGPPPPPRYGINRQMEALGI